MRSYVLINPTQQVRALYTAEYGNALDIFLRASGVFVGAILGFVYTGWIAALVWAGVFALVHAVQWPFLRSRLDDATERDAKIGGVLFLAVHISFIWLPVRAASNDDSGLMLVGMMVFTITALYHVKRADLARWLVIGQIAIFSCALGFISFSSIQRYEDVIVKVLIALVTANAIYFISIPMLRAHRRRLHFMEANARLAQEQKMSAIGRLAGGVAHDFNNALTVIRGNLELYELFNDETQRKEFISDAFLATERAEGIIQQLLIFSRQMPAQKQKIDANVALEDLARLAKTMVPERIDLSIRKLPVDVRLDVDERHLTAALLNLLKNSVDAIDGHGVIAVELCRHHAHKGRIELRGGHELEGEFVSYVVRDSGSGIPLEHIDKVTDPFFSTKEQGKGTGLGLSMVYGFVSENGGAMKIETSDSGSSISLYFPLAS